MIATTLCRIGLLALVSLSTAACAPSSDDPVEAGRLTYAANCTACHHPNPKIDGNMGPAIAGSPRDLVEARVMRAEYPLGYQPKRDSTIMQALPFLKNEIDGLAAFLAAEGG